MSFFKKILISDEMSGKIEVIVSEHWADNKIWLQTWEEFFEDVSERHREIDGWEHNYTNTDNSCLCKLTGYFVVCFKINLLF